MIIFFCLCFFYFVRLLVFVCVFLVFVCVFILWLIWWQHDGSHGFDSHGAEQKIKYKREGVRTPETK